MRKKITIIVGGLGGGGAERVALLLANGLLKNQYHVDIISFSKDSKSYENSCPVYYLAGKSRFQSLLSLRNIIKKLNPDVIIAFQYNVAMNTVIAATGFNKKVIVSERNDPHIFDNRKLKSFFRNFLFQKADILVCQTDEAKRYFENKIKVKTEVIMNPIKGGLPKWEKDNFDNKVITFCRLEKQKNLPMLINAFTEVLEEYPDYRLQIYGEGTLKGELEELIKEKNIENSAEINPFSPNIHSIASKCNMFVLSSDYEGLSNSMLEAMAMGMPVICTDCPIGGARMVIENGKNGILVPVGDSHGMAEAIKKVIREQSFAFEIGRNAEKINDILSQEKIIRQWMEII
jgi:glycosyltransferase involved in cell wall biosynthesis